ncbi:MAG: hypothetical protein JNM68_14785, partial [Dinghuibacter sp.]|nr:hypothetical protein [Dinghuibacter sp.]
MEHYFQTYQRYFWQWEEKGEVLAIPQHNSIAYRGYLQQVVHHLSKQGLPPFGSLLLAIIATNKNSDAALNAVIKIVGLSLDEHHSKLLTNSVAFLKILSELPAEYREGHKRILMLQAIFENCHNISSRKVSTESAKQLSEDFFGVHNLNPKSMPGAVLVYRDFRPLELLHARFKTPEDIIQKMASLPSLPEELLLTEIQAEQATKEKDLVEQLLLNDKTFFVGSLVKRIWGGLNIPVHSSLPSAQPLGGISDLTNKGDFDKLLISEFANDNLVFLSRLANNEALYIHREIPPEKNNLHRIILIDCSLKNWGTPKTIAFAVMLAIARHPKTDIPCTVYAVGEQYHPIAIDNIHSIIEGLMQLNGQLHAAAGLERFFAEHPAHKQSEVFFITNPSALKHEALLRTLNEYYPRIHYTIYTDAAGNIDVYKKQQGGKKHIQHLLLPLEELWKKEPAPQQPQPQAGMHFTSFPLLFPRTTGIKYQVQLPDNQVLIVNKERQVLRVYDNSP